MKNRQVEDLVSVEVTCTIENFSKLNTNMHYSEVFVIGDFKWKILIFPKGKYLHKHLSMYLDVAYASTLPYGWARHAKFSLTVVNQLDSNKSITKKTHRVREFKPWASAWGFASFMPLSTLCDRSAGYLVNDICIVEAKVKIRKPDIKIAPSSPQVCTTSPVNLSVVKAGGELMDFRGLGQIEKAFVPLLEEVCSWHPSLIECQRKRSRVFAEWEFTALGRLLYFLKTTKFKDMTEHACEQLQLLWEEVETFRFDLAWLEPHVQSALGMKKFVERAEQAKKLRENVEALEIEVKRLRARAVVAEVDLEVARRDLAKTEDGLGEIEMDGEIGYGSRWPYCKKLFHITDMQPI